MQTEMASVITMNCDLLEVFLVKPLLESGQFTKLILERTGGHVCPVPRGTTSGAPVSFEPHASGLGVVLPQMAFKSLQCIRETCRNLDDKFLSRSISDPPYKKLQIM